MTAVQERTEQATSAVAQRPRTTPRWVACGVVVAALIIGSLLNADGLRRTAELQLPGWRRDLAMAATDPLVDVSHALRLDRPRAWVDDLRTSDEKPAPLPTAEPTAEPSTQPTDHPTANPSATASASPTSPSRPGTFVPTPSRPARLWVTGDSLTESFGPALVNVADGTGVIDARREVQYSSGLTRPDFFDWPRHLLAEIGDHRTDILVFMIGANDGQPIRTASGWQSFGTDQWKAEYRRRVAATMSAAAARVATVYWVGQPIARSESYSRRVSVMNEIYRTEAERHPGVRYVDSWSVFLGPDGGYSAYLRDASGEMVLMRRSDGIHLTPAGGRRLAAVVVDAIRRDWRIPR